MDVSVTIRSSLPAGTRVGYGGGVVPFGFLKEEGQLLQVSVYPRLFEAIGYTWGGEGPNFRLPDSRSRGDIGSGQGTGLSNRTLGQYGGEETHQLTEAEMPSHTHTQNPHSHVQDAHSHSTTMREVSLQLGSGAIVGDILRGDSGARGSTNAQPAIANATATNQNAGGNGHHNNMQPYLVATKMIKF